MNITTHKKFKYTKGIKPNLGSLKEQINIMLIVYTYFLFLKNILQEKIKNNSKTIDKFKTRVYNIRTSFFDRVGIANLQK